MFGKPIYDGEVPENSPAGTPIINVTAVDADKGMFGVVTYSLAGLCLCLLAFSILLSLLLCSVPTCMCQSWSCNCFLSSCRTSNNLFRSPKYLSLF